MRGLFSAGVMDVLMENEIWPDGVIGVSAGAAFGCNMKSKQPSHQLKTIRAWRLLLIQVLSSLSFILSIRPTNNIMIWELEKTKFPMVTHYPLIFF